MLTGSSFFWTAYEMSVVSATKEKSRSRVLFSHTSGGLCFTVRGFLGHHAKSVNAFPKTGSVAKNLMSHPVVRDMDEKVGIFECLTETLKGTEKYVPCAFSRKRI